MKNINIPLTDEQWSTLKELATLRKLFGETPSSITQLILEPLVGVMPSYEIGLRVLRGATRKSSSK